MNKSAAQKLLCRKMTAYRRTGRLLTPPELLRLYRHRHRVKPRQSELPLFLSSMLREEKHRMERSRRQLGWYFLRDLSAADLFRLLRDVSVNSDPRVRVPAMEAIGYFKTNAAFRVLAKATHDLDATVAAIAVKALGRFGRKALPLLRRIAVNAKLAREPRREAIYALAEIALPAAWPFLLRLGNDPAVAWPVLHVVGKHPEPKHAFLPRQLTQSTDKYLRFKAWIVLRALKLPEDRDRMLAAAKDKNRPERDFAAQALAELAVAADAPLFERWARDPDWRMRQAAATYFGNTKQPTSVPLLKRLVLRGGLARHDASRALCRLSRKHAWSVVLELIENSHSDIRSITLRALVEAGWPEAKALLERFAGDAYPKEHFTVASAMAASDRPVNLPLIRRLAVGGDPNVAEPAARGLAKHGKPKDLPLFRRLMRDPDPVAQFWAARGFSRLATSAQIEKTLADDLPFDATATLDQARYRPRWWSDACAHYRPTIGTWDIEEAYPWLG